MSLFDLEAELSPSQFSKDNANRIPNIWRLIVGSVAMEASHNLSPILMLKGNHFNNKVIDIEHNIGGWTQDISFIVQFSRKEDRSVEADVDLRDVDLHISCETVSSFTAIAKR